jgi:hypothetical protein
MHPFRKCASDLTLLWAITQNPCSVVTFRTANQWGRTVAMVLLFGSGNSEDKGSRCGEVFFKAAKFKNISVIVSRNVVLRVFQSRI